MLYQAVKKIRGSRLCGAPDSIMVREEHQEERYAVWFDGCPVMLYNQYNTCNFMEALR